MPRIKKDHPCIGWGYHRVMAKLKSKKLLQEIIKERPDKSEAELKIDYVDDIVTVKYRKKI